jgi:hypothetical protein
MMTDCGTDLNELISMPRAARELGKSLTTLQNWVALRKIPFERHSGRAFIRRYELDRLKVRREIDASKDA